MTCAKIEIKMRFATAKKQNKAIYEKKHPPFRRMLFRAPLPVEMLNLWKDFRKVVQFIDENENWVKPLLAAIKKTEGIE